MRSRYVPDRGFVKRVSVAGEMVEFVEDKAEEAAEHTRSVAPVDEGEYVDSIESGAVIEDGTAKGRVSANDDKWAYLEFGTEDTPVFAPLRKGLEATSGVKTER